LQQLLLAAVSHCPDHTVRREITVAVSRMLACIEVDGKIKETVKPFLQAAAGGRSDKDPIIEDVYNEDGDAEDEEEEEEVVSLDTKMERALLPTAALLLSKKDCGAFALSTGWIDARHRTVQSH
jgi:hypothetical protein